MRYKAVKNEEVVRVDVRRVTVSVGFLSALEKEKSRSWWVGEEWYICAYKRVSSEFSKPFLPL